MRVEHLYYFKCLAEILNYTQASQKLYIGQSTLSSAIKTLENEIGAVLFTRNKGSRIELTEAGARFYEQITLSLQNLEKGILIAKEAEGAVCETIRLGTIHAMQGKVWAKALSKFKNECNIDFKLVIEQGYSQDLIRKIRSGALDVAFTSRVLGDNDLEHILCWSEPLVLGVHIDHPLAKKKSVSLRDLSNTRIVTYAETSPISEPLSDLLKDYDYELNLIRDYMDEVSMSSLVASDKNNVAIFCYSFLCNAFDEVVCIPIEEAPFDFHKTYITYKADQYRLKVIQEFIDFMSNYLITKSFKRLHETNVPFAGRENM